MATPFTGVRVVETTAQRINELYKTKKIVIGKKDFPNSFIVFKSDSQSALTRVNQDGETASLISDKLKASNIKPRNKEQFMALDMLLDDSVTVCIMTGRAGSGKTLLSLAAALQKMDEEKYDRIILTRPMSQVGRYDLGALPGSVDEKFMPYLGNYESNLSQFASKDITHLMERYHIECRPLQLMRGASYAKTFIIADETQILDEHEMLTLGTRVGEGSKIVILGDLNQRDEKIAVNNTGLYKMMNHKLSKESTLVAAIELLKVERSETCKLFADIFEKKEK